MTPKTAIDRNKEKQQHMHCTWITSRVTQTDTNSWVVIISVTGLDRVVCSSACASWVRCLASLVVAMEICLAYLVGMCFTLSGGGQKFPPKHCCESFNLRTYDCFALKRLLRKKGHFSVQSCSSTKRITQNIEMQTSWSKWEWPYQEGMTMSWKV